MRSSDDAWVIERAYLYCRQSRAYGDADRSLSLASQERLLRDEAAARGLIVVGVEVDANLRGRQDERARWRVRPARVL